MFFFSAKFLEKEEFIFFQKFRLGRNLTQQPPLGNAWSRDARSFRKLLRVALWDSTDEIRIFPETDMYLTISMANGTDPVYAAALGFLIGCFSFLLN